MSTAQHGGFGAVPVTPTKTATHSISHHLPHHHYTPRGLHTIPQPFHFNSSHHRAPASAAPTVPLSHKENAVPPLDNPPLDSALKRPQPPSTPILSARATVLGSRTPQSLFSHRQRTTAPANAGDVLGIRGAESATAVAVMDAVSGGRAAPARVAEDAVSRRLDAEFSVDAASLAAILHPATPAPSASMAAIADFTQSDRQSILVSAQQPATTASTCPQLTAF